MKATRTTSSGADLRSIQPTDEALLEIARDEISLAERIVCEWIASQERIAIASIEAHERLQLARLRSEDQEEERTTGPAFSSEELIARVLPLVPALAEAFAALSKAPTTGQAPANDAEASHADHG